MRRRKPRTLKLGDVVYLWRVEHRHNPRPAPGDQGCVEVFWAVREGFREDPLRVLFPETEEHGPGFPRCEGVVVDYREPGWSLNLNRPKVARLLIELGTRSGWVPGSAQREFILPDGYELILAHSAEVDRALASGTPGALRWAY